MSNTHKYSYIRIKHLASGAFWGLLFSCLPRKKNRIIFNSTCNRFYNFNSKYLFEYFLKQPGWECRFVIDDEYLRERLIKEKGPYFISSKGMLNKAYILNAAVWVTSSLETPVGGVGLAFRRFVYHMGHGTPVKATGLADASASWYKKWYYALVRTNFSCFLAASEKAVDFIQQTFKCKKDKIVIKGQPRLAPLVLYDVPPKKAGLRVLYAPTWRKNSQSKIFPFADYNKDALEKFLTENNVQIDLRLHPYFENSSYVNEFLSEHVKSLPTSKAPEIMDVLSNYDIVITDYSSIYVDFLVLNRPVMFFPYDLKEYSKSTSFVAPYRELTPGPHVLSQRDFIAELEGLLSGRDDYSSERQRLSELLNGEVSAPCRENFEFINHIVAAKI